MMMRRPSREVSSLTEAQAGLRDNISPPSSRINKTSRRWLTQTVDEAINANSASLTHPLPSRPPPPQWKDHGEVLTLAEKGDTRSAN